MSPPATSAPLLSVCVVNWNTKGDLRACLLALAAHPWTGGTQEVIVVDNASADGSAEMVACEFPDVTLVANDRNLNFARGTNQAVARAGGAYLLLLNPDVVVTPGALDTLVLALDAGEHRGAVAPRLRFPDGTTQRSVRGLPHPQAVLWDILGLARVFPKRFGGYRLAAFDYDRAGLAPQPMASCFLIARRAWNQVGPMDEAFPLYFNDADWCLRAHRKGWQIWYTPDATVTHGGGGTTKAVRVAAVWESHRALLRLYHKRYNDAPRLLVALLTVLVTLGAWARTKRWGQPLGRYGGETTPESLHRELERTG